MKFKKVFKEILSTVYSYESTPEHNFNKEFDPKNIKSAGFTDLSDTASICVSELLSPKTKAIKNNGSDKIASINRLKIKI